MNRSIKILMSSNLFFTLLLIACSTNYRSVNTVSTSLPSLTGKWLVSNKTISAFAIIPRCTVVKPGATFNFTSDKLEIYLEKSPLPCDIFSFKVTNNTLSFIKEDMIYLCTYELDGKVLKIQSKSFFTLPISNNLTLPNQSLSTNDGFIVTLTKI